jgi:FtsH-binding integral membrane protein
MDNLDYILAVGGVLVFIFTIVMDVLLIREWIRKRREKQEPPEHPND